MRKIIQQVSLLTVTMVLALAAISQAQAVDGINCEFLCAGITADCDGTNDECFCDSDECWGTDGDDVMCGDGSDQTFYAGKGHDTVCAGGGADEIHGGFGNDCLYGMAGDDHLYGGHCADNLDGGADTDVCLGGWGDDTADSCDFSQGKTDDHPTKGDCYTGPWFCTGIVN